MTSRHFIISKERVSGSDRIDYSSHSQNPSKNDIPTLEAMTSVVNISGTYTVYLGTRIKEDFKPTDIQSQACEIAYQSIVSSTKRMMYQGDTLEDTVNELEQRELFNFGV
ncbi:hypothetical protein EXS72_02135 [Candidatus Pacearchaeota archaeon]|nr:hypothetical protein [Candidatus Pacearchaeota archaeon]